MENERALVHFSNHEEAKVALAGNLSCIILNFDVVGLNKFMVDKSGSELKVKFYHEE